MTYLTSIDLLIRQQLILQKIAELGNVYADDLRCGKKCELKDRDKLLMLEIYNELINDYKLASNGINSIATIEIQFLTPGKVFNVYQFFVDGTPITDVLQYTLTGIDDNLNVLNSIVNSINTYQNIFTATLSETTVIVNGPCTNGLMTSETLLCGFIYTNFTGGICNELITTNCITEEQIQTLFDTISEEYNICFPPLGATF